MIDTKRVEEILRTAAAAVVAANLPKELQGIAFGKAVDLIAGLGVAPVSSVVQRDDADIEAKPSDDPLQNIANRLDLDRDLVDETFHIEDGALKLIISRSKLQSSKARGAQEIAVLVAAARQAAAIEQWTEVKTLRSVADDYGKFDSANFAAAISDLGDYFSFDGTGRSRRVKVRRDGYKEAGAIINRIHGKSGG